MPPEQKDQSLLWDMQTAADKIRRFVAGKTFSDYERDEMLQSAVERQVEIIGEAARNVSEGFQKEHPELPWRGIVAQRHFLAQEYGEIRHEKLWRVATVRIPELLAMLKALVPPPPPDP